MNALTLRERRLIALAILAAVLAVVWLAVASPILQGFAARREAKADARAELQRNARLVQDFATYRREAAAERRAAAAYAIDTPQPLAAADIARGRAARAVADAGGLLQALRTERAPAREVRLQANVRIGLAGLTGLVRRLEDDRPYAVVDALTIAAPEQPNAGGLSPLEVSLDLSYAYAPPR